MRATVPRTKPPMSDDPLDRQSSASRAAGHPVARARIVSGPGTGRSMLIWPAGEVFGDLGSPRLSQRVSLYVEAQFSKGWKNAGAKRFDHGDDAYEVAFDIHTPEGMGTPAPEPVAR